MKEKGKHLFFPNTQMITMITLTIKKDLMKKKSINNRLMLFRAQFKSQKTKEIMM